MGDSTPACSKILQDQAGVRAPTETRVSRGRADPHVNSGVQTQTQSAAVEVGVQAIEIETQVSGADLEFDLERLDYSPPPPLPEFPYLPELGDFEAHRTRQFSNKPALDSSR